MRLSNPFTTLYRHRDLVVQFTLRELQLRHKGSRLGHFWALLSPMTMLGLYLFVFGFIFKSKFLDDANETTFDYAITLFLGLIFFHVIAEAIAAAPLLIVNQPNYVKKVVFPLEIIPLATVASSAYHALLSILLLLVVAPFSHMGIDWAGVALLPLLLLPLVLIALGLAWGLAALGVFVRDISHMTPFASTAIMFSSCIFYPTSLAKDEPLIWVWLKYNPLLVLVDEARKLLFWREAIDFVALGYVYGVAGISVTLGYLLFATLRPYFAEVI
ncbi:MAG: ABC transporter permease [Opitutae bacterium]|nr:ABC transporter permease [Opitutae bacterium]